VFLAAHKDSTFFEIKNVVNHEIILKPLANRLKEFHSFCMVCVGLNIYTFWGDMKDVKTNSCWIYSILSDTWTQGPNLKSKRSSGCAVVIADRYIYAFAGRPAKTLTNIEVLDTKSENPEWTALNIDFPKE